jgi:peptidyl-prolyl cis-trans isomerase C
MTKYFTLIGTALILLISCGAKQKTESTSTTPNTTGGTVLAKVNSAVLTFEDLKLQLPIEYRDQLRGKDLQDAIDTWVNTELLAQLGQEMGVDKSPEIAAVMRFRKADAIARRLVEIEVTNKTAVQPSEVDSAYNADKESYKVDKDKMRASHILVGSQEEADAIYTRLKKGDDFAQLAQDYSVDRQSAAQGGDIGYFSADQIDPEFGKAAEKLKVGEYSQPVKTKYGFHLIKLTDRMVAGTSLNSVEVKSKIEEGLKAAKQGQAFNQLLDSLKAKAKIERFTPAGLGLEPTSGAVGQ